MQLARHRITVRASRARAARSMIAGSAAILALVGTAWTPVLAGPATSFAPGEGTGRAWCPYYGGISLGSYRNVYACRPRNKNKNAGKTPFDSYAGFQCTELANRFLYTVTGHVLFANEEGGNYVALAAAQYKIPVGASGSPGVLPAAGDIVSMWGGRSRQRRNGGRTEVAVVTRVTTTASGWAITTLNQGDPSDTDGARGFNTITVSANGKSWSALDGFYARFDWLKLARSPGRRSNGGGSLTWSSAEAPPGASTPASRLLSVACLSASDCTAVGTSGSAALLVYRSGSGWSAATVPVPSAPSSGARLAAVTCARVTGCLAAGDYRSAGRQEGLLLTGHNASWTATRAPLPSAAAYNPHVSLASATCPATTWCVVVGQYTGRRPRSSYPLLVTGHASAWSGRRAPLPADAARRPAARLSSVACPATGYCVAVGSYRDKAGNEQGLIVTQSRSGWTATRAALPASAVTPGARLSSVSCPGRTTCEAAGTFSANQRSMILTGSATIWHSVAAPLPAGPRGRPHATAPQITCVSVTDCTMVGSYSAGRDGNQGLLVTGHGSAWQAVRAPLPDGAAARQGAPGARLTSAACASDTVCVAAGQYTDSAGEAGLLLLTLQRSAWAASPGPLPANDEAVGSQAQGSLGPPSLASVACPAPGTCVAVGGYPVHSAGMEGLVETSHR